MEIITVRCRPGAQFLLSHLGVLSIETRELSIRDL